MSKKIEIEITANISPALRRLVEETGGSVYRCERPQERVARDDGLTDDEGDVMDALVDAVGHFNELPRQHPQELEEFIGAIHRCQDLLACRIARRHHPNGWLTHNLEVK